MKERVSMLTNQVKTELHGWQFCAPVLHQQQPALPVPRLWTHTCPGQHSIFHFLFTFTEIRFRHNTFCAFVCCKVLTAQTAFGAKMKGFIINITLCVCIENGSFLVFPEGTLFWLYCDTPLWHRNEGEPCFTCHGEKCHKMLTYLLKVARIHFHWAVFSHLQSSEM